MLDRRSKFLWSFIIVGAFIFIRLLWATAGTRDVAPVTNNPSGTLGTISLPIMADSRIHASSSLANANNKSVEAEIITIRPNGFEPAEIVRPKGRVLLAVNNRAELAEVDLQLQQEHGAKLQEAHVARKQQNFRKVVDLSPGNYLLTEANHPGWVCRITITN